MEINNDLSRDPGQFANLQVGALVYYDPHLKMPKITVKNRGRFFSQHAGALVYHDSRHKVYKVQMEGGHVFEMVQEKQRDGSFRAQLLTTHAPEGGASVIMYNHA